MARNAAIAIARFFEYASGLKSRPSWSTSVKTGRNATAMTRSEKKTEGPTSISASRRTLWKSPGRPPSFHCWSFLYAFSTSTIAPSTRMPMEIAMPPSDMMLMSRPIALNGMNARITEIGIVTMGTIALGTCQRKTRMTSETTTISSISFDRSVSTERLIRSDRSYVVTIFTPGGSDGSISFSRAFTRSITSSAFSPLRITTMPPTASPFPSRSVIPRRISGPSDTRPMSATVSGVPFSFVLTTIFPMSSIDLR